MIAEAVMCLALNIYNEANTDPDEGQLAVGLVTLNRAHDNNTSVCWEVFRAAQFTWTDDRAKRASLPKGAAWKHALSIAKESQRLHKTGEDFTGGATEYHLERMDGKIFLPWWAEYMHRIGKWGSHIFYKKED